MSNRYDVFELGDVLLALSDREAGALLKALALYRRNGSRDTSELPYNVRAIAAGEFGKIDKDRLHAAKISDVRRKAVACRYNCKQMNTNDTIVPPLKNLPCINNPPSLLPAEERENPQGGRKLKKFVRPKVEEVAAYCLERKNNLNPESFCDFYESKGWRVGSQPMKDWKAAVRTWERRHAHEAGNSPVIRERSEVL